MTLIQIVTLALIQGITEFLPVSSSGHLVLTPIIMNWKDQGLALDVAVHVGTLGAVMVYLWRDLWLITRGLFRLPAGQVDDGARQLCRQIGRSPGKVSAAGSSRWQKLFR